MDPERLAGALDRAASQVKAPGAAVALLHRHGTTTAGSGATTVGSAGRAVAASDWFEVGSVTKAMTATVVLQLVAEGRVTDDDPVVSHLPSFRLATRSASEGRDASAPTPRLGALTGSYRRRHVQVDVAGDDAALTATIRRKGAVAELFGDEPAVARTCGGNAVHALPT